MGSLCSRAGTHSGERDEQWSSARRNGRAQTTGGQTGGQPDPRTAAARAAEERLKAQKARGTNPANPNRGRLAAQLEATKAAPRAPAPPEPERLVWD